MSENDPNDPEDPEVPEDEAEAEREPEESSDDDGDGDGDADSPVVETVKQSDGETVAPDDSENTDRTTGDGGDIDGS